MQLTDDDKESSMSISIDLSQSDTTYKNRLTTTQERHKDDDFSIQPSSI